MQRKIAVALLAIGCGWNAPAQAPSWDSSGNALLSGTYYFRHVVWTDVDGDIGAAATTYGTITFASATGTYTINGQTRRSGDGSFSTLINVTGAYTISSSGYGVIDNGFDASGGIYGLVGQNGVFIGSTTESRGSSNDLFIAAPIGYTQATAATFIGNYAIVDLDDSGAGLRESWQYAQNVLMTVTSQGDGSLGTIALNGYVGGSTSVNQSVSGAQYTFSEGAGSIKLPGPSTNLLSGDYLLYISPDGNFVFGGSPKGWDMFVGVRTGSGTPNFSGLYYQAGMDVSLGYVDEYGTIDLDGYYGSFRAWPAVVLGQQRFSDQVNGNSYDFSYADDYTFNTDGTIDSEHLGQHYILSADGAVRIGLGNPGQPVIGLSVAVRAPPFNGTGLMFDPTGITNAASSALFTSRIAPGELLTLHGAPGSTLDAGPAQDAAFPTILAGVRVTINGIFAPILDVNECGSSPCITVMVPYEIQGLYAQIQVSSGEAVSNTIAAVVGSSAPGLFTIPAGGVGYAAAQHASSFAPITPSDPASIGETIVVYVTGLGGMQPAVADGAAGPSNILAKAVESVAAFIGGVPATVTFTGLTPGVVGLTQVNLVVPSGVTRGDNSLDLATCPADCATNGFDSYTSEAMISISESTGDISSPSSIPFSQQAHRRNRPLAPRIHP